MVKLHLQAALLVYLLSEVRACQGKLYKLHNGSILVWKDSPVTGSQKENLSSSLELLFDS